MAILPRRQKPELRRKDSLNVNLTFDDTLNKQQKVICKLFRTVPTVKNFLDLLTLYI